MNVRLTASLAALVLSAAFLSGPTAQAAPGQLGPSLEMSAKATLVTPASLTVDVEARTGARTRR